MSEAPETIPKLTGDGRDGYTSRAQYEQERDAWLIAMGEKKRSKALLPREMYDQIVGVMHELEGRSRTLGTAQFRYWAKRSFTLKVDRDPENEALSYYTLHHEHRPVAVEEQIYDILVAAHALCEHGGRDRTCTIVRNHFSWIPKELVARFVAKCPACRARTLKDTEYFRLRDTEGYYPVSQETRAVSIKAGYAQHSSYAKTLRYEPLVDTCFRSEDQTQPDTEARNSALDCLAGGDAPRGSAVPLAETTATQGKPRVVNPYKKPLVDSQPMKRFRNASENDYPEAVISKAVGNKRSKARGGDDTPTTTLSGNLGFAGMVGDIPVNPCGEGGGEMKIFYHEQEGSQTMDFKLALNRGGEVGKPMFALPEFDGHRSLEGMDGRQDASCLSIPDLECINPLSVETSGGDISCDTSVNTSYGETALDPSLAQWCFQASENPEPQQNKPDLPLSGHQLTFSTTAGGYFPSPLCMLDGTHDLPVTLSHGSHLADSDVSARWLHPSY